ncbi:MAG: tetratricopeptide repeat protein, partial [Anaerolineae bacterium]|nr:tetratricopeptide repeat protein [Anaerolineae bacterium]
IGEQFEEDLLLHLFTSTRRQESEEALWQHLEELRNADMLQEFEDTEQRWHYRFRHGLVQQVAYENMLLEKRREYHGLAGEWLEAQHGDDLVRYYEVLAHHFSHSLLRDKALLYLDKAARKAQHDYANEAALRYYAQALAMEERWEWRKGQVEVLYILGRREEERAALELLQTLAGAPDCDVAYLWGQYHEAIGEFAQAQQATERALENQQIDALGRTRCLVQLGAIAHRLGNYEHAQAWYDQALSLFRERGVSLEGGKPVLAQALNGLGSIYRQQGRFDRAKTFYQRALTLGRSHGDRLHEARALSSLGATAFYGQHFDEARDYYHDALEIYRAIGDRAGEGTCLYNLATLMRGVGDYSQARQHYAAALTMQQAIGNRWEELNVWNDLGNLYQELGDSATARTYMQRGLALAQEIGDEAGQAYILASLGLVIYDEGELETAQTLLVQGLSLAEKENDRRLVSYFLSYLGMVALSMENTAIASTYAQKALNLRQELGLRTLAVDDLATLATIYMQTDRLAEALDYVRQALQILHECEGVGPEFPQRDGFICYQVLSAAGQLEAAHNALLSAHAVVMARADKIADPALRRSFLEQVSANREIVQAYEKIERAA